MWRGLYGVIAVKAQVAVAPVQCPHLGRSGVAQAGDGKAAPVRSIVLAPGRSALDDREMFWGGVAFDAYLVACVLGHPVSAPPLYSRDVEVGQGHRITSR